MSMEGIGMEGIKTVSSGDGMEYLKAKLYRLPGKFREQFYRKEWAGAKYTYDTACRVALFMELPREERDRLFGSRQDYPERVIEGLFPEWMVDRVYLECVVKRSLGFEDEKTPPSPFLEYEKSR